MTNRIRLLASAFLGAALLLTAPPRAVAQAAPDHPAIKVVQEYLSMILTRQWQKSTDIVDESSIKTLQTDYVERVKQARTIDEEEAMLRRVGKATLEEVAKMPAREWYSAFNEGLKAQYKLEDEKLAEIRQSITLKTLSIASDDDGKLVHVLVKASYSTGEARIERLDLTTLRNNGGKWQVVLDGQSPKVTQLKPAAAPAPAPKPPAPAPAPKVTPKPATKPKRPA